MNAELGPGPGCAAFLSCRKTIASGVNPNQTCEGRLLIVSAAGVALAQDVASEN
jgi:hypothetical protein